MTSSETKPQLANARTVNVLDDMLVVDLTDQRTVRVPVFWFPRLAYGSIEQRAHWRLIGGGTGIHWPELDEDISVESLLAGRRSGETAESLERWRSRRMHRQTAPPAAPLASGQSLRVGGWSWAVHPNENSLDEIKREFVLPSPSGASTVPPMKFPDGANSSDMPYMAAPALGFRGHPTTTFGWRARQGARKKRSRSFAA
jgi:hypothetical protein